MNIQPRSTITNLYYGNVKVPAHSIDVASDESVARKLEELERTKKANEELREEITTKSNELQSKKVKNEKLEQEKLQYAEHMKGMEDEIIAKDSSSRSSKRERGVTKEN